jgi:hypothetical protein
VAQRVCRSLCHLVTGAVSTPHNRTNLFFDSDDPAVDAPAAWLLILDFGFCGSWRSNGATVVVFVLIGYCCCFFTGTVFYGTIVIRKPAGGKAPMWDSKFALG